MAASANTADGKSEKRAKTGGRPAKLALDEMIANAERRGRLAALPDDTTVEAELAAFRRHDSVYHPIFYTYLSEPSAKLIEQLELAETRDPKTPPRAMKTRRDTI